MGHHLTNWATPVRAKIKIIYVDLKLVFENLIKYFDISKTICKFICNTSVHLIAHVKNWHHISHMLHLGKHESKVIKLSILQNVPQLPCAALMKTELISGHFWNHELEPGKQQDHVHLVPLGSNALLCKNLCQSCYLREKGLIGTLICLFFYPSGSTAQIAL